MKMIREQEKVFIHPTADISHSARIGSGSRVWRFTQICEDAVVGDDCTISKDVYVDSGVVIGNRVKIQNGVSVYKGVTLDDDSFVGPHAAFTNDNMPRSFSEKWDVVPTYVGKGASIGANATIICGVVLGPYCMIAAGSTLTTDAPPHGLMTGSPARLVAYICKRGHRMIRSSVNGYKAMYCCSICGESLSVAYVLHNSGSGDETLDRQSMSQV